jgi:hypothetical protein
MGYAKKDAIIERINHNYYTFEESLGGQSRTKLFEMVEHIACVKQVYEYLTTVYEWDDENEIDGFLLFRDPLAIVADAWERHRAYSLSFIESEIRDFFSEDDIFSEYPLSDDAYDRIIICGTDY